jgi:hypothetical protein
VNGTEQGRRLAELTCEACGKAPANKGDILCVDCAHAYFILLDLLKKHPKVDKNDLTRLRDLLDWRNQKEKKWLDKLYPSRASNDKAPLQTTE